jgi:hypothetical protein
MTNAKKTKQALPIKHKPSLPKHIQSPNTNHNNGQGNGKELTNTHNRPPRNWRIQQMNGQDTYKHSLYIPNPFTTTTLYASIQPVSRTIELSLQSSFQLSLTVLVYYRIHGHI